jgi:hypothetical protein
MNFIHRFLLYILMVLMRLSLLVFNMKCFHQGLKNILIARFIYLINIKISQLKFVLSIYGFFYLKEVHYTVRLLLMDILK